MPKLLDDVNAALEKIRSIGGASAASLPEQLTAEQKQQAADAIKDLSVEIYTGAEDKILRRMVVTMKIDAPATSATRRAVGGRQARPPAARPQRGPGDQGAREHEAVRGAGVAAELARPQLGGLGAGAGGGTSGSSGSGSGATEENLEKYSECVQDAGGDTAKIRKCADLLAAP